MGVLPDDVSVLFAIVDKPLGFGARKRRPWAEVVRAERKRKYTHPTAGRSTETGERLKARF